MKNMRWTPGLGLRLKRMGAACQDLDFVGQALTRHVHLAAGADIARDGESATQSTVLLAGMAAAYKRTKDGDRRLYSFQYAGDFCDLYRYALPDGETTSGVKAVTNVVIGMIDQRDLDRLMSRPALALAFWRAAMLEAALGRQRRAIAGGGSVLERVAHFLNEQVVRREAVGIHDGPLPVLPIDIADAVGLSVLDVDLAIESLRSCKILSEERGVIAVLARQQLADVAKFDGRSLDMPGLLSGWAVEVN
jgi:CRP-like cAMP-binding protein